MWEKVVLFVVVGLSWGIPLVAQTAEDCQKCDCYHPPVPKRCEKCCGIVKEVEKLDDEIFNAAKKGDAAVFEKTLADNYIRIWGNGQIFTKSETLDVYKSGRLKWDTIDLKNRRVRVYGNTAIVMREDNINSRMGSKDFSGTYRTTIVYVKMKNGQWQVVSSQTTKVQPQGK